MFYDKRIRKKQCVQAEHVQHRDVYHNDAALTYLCEISYSLNSEFRSGHQRIGMEWNGVDVCRQIGCFIKSIDLKHLQVIWKPSDINGQKN